ncbi:MAG TPA: M55 family metallopeptidase [Anaerolineae bacterium]|nr:M55 family metallopeptidase [Anaerolineae bacterium]HOG46033.1 M55 family metallopeptidase [Anaerolineae bacterium]HOR00122.1 M55 family metallopeptidase [Anaerolineae bacterium]HPL28183.1 M55 family metallopeptidase [Anaerolineae bacterium]
MKIYVICDLEGTAGVVDHRRQCWFDGADYPQARRLATLELNALVEGALEGGATDILAWDGHGNFPGGLDPELVHPACRLITGAGDGGSVAVDSSFDAMFLLGLHAMAGAERSVLAHSFWPGVAACWLNGVKIGEVGLNTFTFGRMGVPTVFISGDRAGAEEARALIPAIEMAVVKEGLATTCIGEKGLEPSPAITLAPEQARQVIRGAAWRAMGKVGTVAPWSLEPPYTWRVQFRTEELAAQRASRTGVRRIDACTLETVAAAAPDVIL